MQPHNPFFFNPLGDNHSLDDTPRRIDTIMSDIDDSNQINDYIILDDESNVFSPLRGPVHQIRNEIDTSSPKSVNINRSGSKSDMDSCHSSPNGNINKIDDTKNIVNRTI